MKLIVCIPGNSFSGRFLECWTELSSYLLKKGYQVVLSRKYSPNIYFARNMCLGGNVMMPNENRPFAGRLDYDYILWIDSDIIFTIAQFERLVSRNLDIIAGLYRMADGQRFAAVANCNEDYFIHNGNFEFLTLDKIAHLNEPFRVAYCGLGFALIKKGVFEAIGFPWFKPRNMVVSNTEIQTMEDVNFCLTAQEKGFEVYIDPTVICGHLKETVI